MGPAPEESVVVGGRDAALASRLTGELVAFNVAVAGAGDQRSLSATVHDDTGELVAGLLGWTWGTAAGIEMLWVRADRRHAGWGARLLAAAEAEAVTRGCVQVFVSSLTFQAPGFYERAGYVEFARSEGLPTAGQADVHLRKDLA